MKHFYLAIITGCILYITPHSAIGSCTPLATTQQTSGPGVNYTVVYDDTSNCYGTGNLNYSYIYDGTNGANTSTGWLLKGCGNCKNNKKSVLKRITLSCGYYDIYACDDCPTNNCTNCASDISPSDYSEGYVRTQYRQCLNCSCTITSNYYSCAKGYYGIAGTTASGCTRCPSLDSASATTPSYGSSATTSCYIPSGIDITDNSGTYTFTTNCYYKN